MDYQVIRTQRKTVSLQVDREGKLIIRCPVSYPAKKIEELLSRHAAWIENTQKKVRDEAEKKQKRQGSEVDEVFFLGQVFPIEYTETNSVFFDGACYHVKKEHAKEGVIALLKKQAKPYMLSALEKWAPLVGEKPASLKITSAKGKWGSCSGKKGICFSLYTVMLPPELIDYIAVHELTHLFEMNHSEKFWLRVAKVMPDYKAREKELKKWAKMIWEAGWYDE